MSTQEVIDFDAVARARVDDPVTSHEAAASVTHITATKEVILLLLKKPATDVELVDRYKNAHELDPVSVPRASESGIRSRRAELANAGLVVETGQFGRTPAGRKATIWVTRF